MDKRFITEIAGAQDAQGRSEVKSVTLDDGTVMDADKVPQEVWHNSGLHMNESGGLDVFKPNQH